MDRTDDVNVEKIFEKFSKYFHGCDPFSVSSAFPWYETTGIRGVTDFPFPSHVHIHRFTADEKDFSLSLEMTGEEGGSPHIVFHTVLQRLVPSHQSPVTTLSPSHTPPRPLR